MSRQLFKRIVRGWAVAKTRMRWGWRLGHLGYHCVLGRCRLMTNPSAVSIGEKTTLADGLILADLQPECAGGRGGAKIRIGHHCTFLFDFQVNAAKSVEIGNYVLGAGRVFISDSDHVVDPMGEHVTLSCELVSEPVVIEDDCWLGQNAVILKGVRVGHHSIVAANAVVTRDVPACSIVAGVPARVIGSTRRSASGRLLSKQVVIECSGRRLRGAPEPAMA